MKLRQNSRLPDEIKVRMVSEYGLSSYDASVLTEERETAAFYEAASKGRDRKLVANWMSLSCLARSTELENHWPKARSAPKDWASWSI